tara:strand:- start:1792 stop:2184 length:393 start_codon:yes stop_codon:yes gene_type:complete
MNIHNSIKKELGVRDNQLAPLSKKPNCVSSQTENMSKKVNALSYSKSLQEQMGDVVAVLSGMSGANIMQKSDNYLYVVFTTTIMRFKDDVEVYLDDEAKQLHFRSASRVGYSDLGVNRKRYEAFVAALKG